MRFIKTETSLGISSLAEKRLEALRVISSIDFIEDYDTSKLVEIIAPLEILISDLITECEYESEDLKDCILDLFLIYNHIYKHDRSLDRDQILHMQLLYENLLCGDGIHETVKNITEMENANDYLIQQYKKMTESHIRWDIQMYASVWRFWLDLLKLGRQKYTKIIEQDLNVLISGIDNIFKINQQKEEFLLKEIENLTEGARIAIDLAMFYKLLHVAKIFACYLKSDGSDVDKFKHALNQNFMHLLDFCSDENYLTAVLLLKSATIKNINSKLS